jgi:integrase
MPDGTIAERLYVRAGKRTTTFFYKHADNTNEILASAPTVRPDKVAMAKSEALEKWGKLRGQPNAGGKDPTIKGLFERYFAWQESLPGSSTLKKAASTLDTNRNEQTPLLAYFADMLPRQVTQTHLYEYMDLRAAAGAPKGCVKEVALFSAVMKYAIRKGELEVNPCHGLQVEASAPKTRRVTWDEIEFVTKVGRAAGGSYHVAALAARAAWLAFKRPGEVLKIPRSGQTSEGRPLGVTPEGLVFLANKRRRSQGELTITIEWTPTLRATVDEALQIGRWAAFAGDRLIFGNKAGHRYSKSGWGTIWRRLMAKCAAAAEQLEQPFTPFALQDCRAGGVTEKRRLGQDDVYDGTGHADRRMVDGVYDRRGERSAKPAK